MDARVFAHGHVALFLRGPREVRDMPSPPPFLRISLEQPKRALPATDQQPPLVRAEGKACDLHRVVQWVLSLSFFLGAKGRIVDAPDLHAMARRGDRGQVPR